MRKQPASEAPPPLVPAWRQRRGLLAIALLALVACLALCAGPAWEIALYRLIVDGGCVILWLVAAAGMGAWIPLPLLDDPRTRWLRRVTAIAFGLGLLSLLTLLLGLCGWLNRASAIAIVTMGIVLLGLRMRSRVVWKVDAQAAPPHEWLWLALVPLAALTLSAALIPPGLLWRDEPNGYDVVEYHLQVPREWYEIGRIVPLEHNVFSFFPFNAEMHDLFAMHLRGGPWAGMYLAQLMHVAFAALCILAVYAGARVIASPSVAVLVALTAAGVPWLTQLAPIAYNENAMLLYAAVALTWALAALTCGRADPGCALRACVTGGVAAGFGCGVKLTAVPMLLLAIPAAVLLVRPRLLPACIAFVLAGLLTFSPWLIRNAIWVGNPVFPEAMTLLGRGHFTQVQVERWHRAHSPRPDQASLLGRLRAAREQIVMDWRYGFLLLPVSIAAFILRRRRREAIFLFACFVLVLFIWLFFTHLQGRFFTPAIAAMALLLAVPDDWQWKPILGGCAVVLVAIATIAMAQRLAPFLEARESLLGIETYDWALPQSAASIPGDATLALVGDARAFFYQRPMKRLLYRTVFDVRDESPGDVVSAWLGHPPAPGEWLLIDAGELQRFSQTYWKIAAPTEEMKQRGAPYVQPPR